jgi:hypothetical protein
MQSTAAQEVASSGKAEPPTALTFLPRDWSRAVRAAIISIVATSLFIATLDGFLFRSRLDPGYVAFYTSPLLPRTAYALLGSLIEEVKFRLILMTCLMLVLTRATGLKSLHAAGIAIILSQLANVFPLLLETPLYSLLRFWLVGSTWGWLYFRHGWLTAAIAHPLTHVVMDPLLQLTLRLT